MPNYHDRLHPWCIIHCLPNAQTQIIARFRRRNDAEAHLQVLRRLTPTANYDLVFDVSGNSQEEGDRTDADSTQFQATTLPFYPDTIADNHRKLNF